MTFSELNLHPSLNKALVKQNYEVPTDVQAETIPYALNGNDVLASAQTGTGKTAAFALPILNKILTEKPQKGIKAIIIAPTRELAIQIKASFNDYSVYTNIKTTAVYGGVSKRNQIVSLKRGTDVLIATPGRYLDLHQSKFIKTDKVQTFVLDEVDQMLDMGFIHDIKKIIDTVPNQKQTMVFSATIPATIKPTLNTLLVNPKIVAIKTKEVTLESIKQCLVHTDTKRKQDITLKLLIEGNNQPTLIFTNTKARAEKLTMFLEKNNINVSAIHGDKPQMKRQRALNDFKTNKITVLVATDVASRGIDIKSLPFVINYDVPQDKETYIHRIGRTGRATLEGMAITLCTGQEKHLLSTIENHIKMPIPLHKTLSDKPQPKSKGNSNKPQFTKSKRKTRRHNHKKRFAHAA